MRIDYIRPVHGQYEGSIEEGNQKVDSTLLGEVVRVEEEAVHEPLLELRQPRKHRVHEGGAARGLLDRGEDVGSAQVGRVTSLEGLHADGEEGVRHAEPRAREVLLQLRDRLLVLEQVLGQRLVLRRHTPLVHHGKGLGVRCESELAAALWRGDDADEDVQFGVLEHQVVVTREDQLVVLKRECEDRLRVGHLREQRERVVAELEELAQDGEKGLDIGDEAVRVVDEHLVACVLLLESIVQCWELLHHTLGDLIAHEHGLQVCSGQRLAVLIRTLHEVDGNRMQDLECLRSPRHDVQYWRRSWRSHTTCD